MDISVIIAVYNQTERLKICVNSVCSQITSSLKNRIEILIIDDSSTDHTAEVIQELVQSQQNIHCFQTNKNSGPGIARNIGIEHAKGKWFLFLDSDDLLENHAIATLIEKISLIESNLIETERADLIAYDFNYDNNSDIKLGNPGRTDISSLTKTKTDLIRDYLSLKMDGSVIFTLINRNIIIDNNIRFRKGYHEDIDFMFKVYCMANKIEVLKSKLYIKNNREYSIVNTITEKHICGLFSAYKEIYEFYKKEIHKNDKVIQSFYLGIIAIISTRIRQISMTKCNHDKLYQCIYDEYYKLISVIPEIDEHIKTHEFETKYIKIFNYFIDTYTSPGHNHAEKMDQFMIDIQPKMWSCYDIHNGLYLAPEEIRTCCKRFFKDGIMKGDVALLTSDNYQYTDFNIDNILKEKNKLLIEINKGESDRCSGCNFLEFKDWGKIKLEHLSLEYHSICNMKCIYCSDTYYGGKENQYGVKNLIHSLLEEKYLSECKSIVWGGGEPTLEKDFESIFKSLNNKFPNIQQRVISNATKYIPSIKSGIDTNSILLITSIDAGSPEKFNEIRKNKQFKRVLKNLEMYAENNPQNIIIKYIFMDENASISEVEDFIDKIKEYKLNRCNFQLSYDFKQEFIPEEHLALVNIMYCLLAEENSPLILIDDLLRIRIQNSNIDHNKITKILNDYGYSKYVTTADNKKEIVIWGAGKQTEYLLNDHRFMSLYNIQYIVDDTPEKIGRKFLGYDIYHPSRLLEANHKVLISAVQNSPKVRQRYLDMGLDPDNLIKDMII